MDALGSVFEGYYVSSNRNLPSNSREQSRTTATAYDVLGDP